MSDQPFNIDSLLPAAMAAKVEDLGVKKAALPKMNMFILGILAGAFIALGGIFMTTVLAGAGALPFGIQRLLGGTAFTLGLILVIVGGSELFTGNNLIMMAYASGKVTLRGLLRNWGIVYLGNFAGATLTSILMFFTRQYTFGNGSIGLTALNIANAKAGLDPFQAVALGVMCNALVCLAVWLCYSARSTTDKILSIIPPITCFVAAGFEHSIANMYLIPISLLIKNLAPESFWSLKALADAQVTAGTFANLTLGNLFLRNLLPVTLGNIIGGAVMVGLVYWFVYLRKSTPAKAPEAKKGKA